jgi:dipeptide/tripeptide permease
MVFAAYIFLAVAGALFKPIISGTIAKTTDEETSSVGFGIFYMMINIGGFIGPFIAGFLYKVDWNLVFLMSILTIAINYIFVFFFYREPDRQPSDKTFIQNIGIAFKNIYETLADWRYDLFLLIMAVFWTAFNQLYYSFPVFLDQWVDMDRLSEFLGLAPGTITAPTVTSLDAFFIIILQIYISSQSMKFKPLHSMITGITILGAGLLFMFFTQNPWLVIIGVLIFAIGEMASSPKYTEYVGRIAPSDKKALYMGTSFLPIALGHFAAGWISGKPFEVIADKYFLLERALADNNILLSPEGLTQNEFFIKAQGIMSMDSSQLNQYLWDNYHPSNIWFLFTGIAVAGSLLLFLYDRYILHSKQV